MAAPDHRVTKDDGLTGVIVGQSVTYTIVVEHTGNQDATGVTVVDNFPVDLLLNVTASSGGVVDAVNGTVTWILGNTTIGDVITLTVTGEVASNIPDGVTDLTTTVVVSDDGANGLPADPSDNTATDINSIVTSAAYEVTKDDGQASAIPGESVAYTITVRNIGGRPGVNVVVTDYLPAIFASATADNNGLVDLTGGTVTWNIPTLAVGESVTLTVTGDLAPVAPPSVEEFENRVTVGDDDGASSETSDLNQLVAAPDLRITLSHDGEPAIEGEVKLVTIVVTNEGNQDATGVIISKTLECR